MKFNLNDSERIEYALNSIEAIYNWTESFTKEMFFSDVKTSDAVSFRLMCISLAITDLSSSFINSNFNSYERLILLDLIIPFNKLDFDNEMIWQRLIGSNEQNPLIHDYYILNKMSPEMKTEYRNQKIQEYSTLKTSNSKKNKVVTFSDDFKYPIKSKNSIWTVKLK